VPKRKKRAKVSNHLHPPLASLLHRTEAHPMPFSCTLQTHTSFPSILLCKYTLFFHLS
jgi:hypothetical protein